MDGRRYSHSALGVVGDHLLAQMIQSKKAENEIVHREAVINEAFTLFRSQHTHSTRTSNFHASPQFITRFRRRHRLATTTHKIHRQQPMTAEKENERIDHTAEYYMRVDDAVNKYGTHLTLNADETGAKAVQQPRTSWSIQGQPNTVNTAADSKLGITTMPTIAADGTRLPLQVIVKGKTQRCVNNKHLPAHIHADHSKSGWQTSETLVRYMEDVIAPYTADKPSALILDEYRAHHTAAVKEAASNHHIEIIPVPGGQTATLQPLDVVVNGIIKKKAKQQWVQEKQQPENDADTLTAAVCRIDTAYRSIPASTIQSAFTKAVPILPTLPR